MDDKKRDAELKIARSIGEVRRLILWQTLCINPALSFERAKEIADQDVREFFYRLEEAYKTFFENE